MEKDHYAVLGVARNATTQQIKERFLRLVREHHPDRVEEGEKERAEDEFQAVTAAYNVLSDAEARLAYDRELQSAVHSGQPSREDAVEKVYLRRGVKAFRQGDHRAAAENFDRAVKANPDDARAWHNLARAYHQREQWWTRAAQAAVRACKLEPMNSDYHTLAARILLDVGDPERSMRHFRHALEWGAEEEDLGEEYERASKLTGRRRGRRR